MDGRYSISDAGSFLVAHSLLVREQMMPNGPPGKFRR
jgi:hypothetical protein